MMGLMCSCECIHNIVKHLVLKHQALIGGPLGLRGLPLQSQVLQCVLEVFVDLLRLLAGLQVGQIFPDLLDELV